MSSQSYSTYNSHTHGDRPTTSSQFASRPFTVPTVQCAPQSPDTAAPMEAIEPTTTGFDLSKINLFAGTTDPPTPPTSWDQPAVDSPAGDLEVQLAASQTRGQPLSEEIRNFMEPRFGVDFRGVRVHTEDAAIQMNRALGAQAFAHGNHVYYGAGKGPGKDALTAHELTHVVQQSGETLPKMKNVDSAPAASREHPPPTAIALKANPQITPTPSHESVQLSPLSDQLQQVWNTQGKGAFFQQLRTLASPPDADVHTFVRTTLIGDDRWLAQNLLTYGREANWPIHLRVEREMKGWGDSGGKGAVFQILRTANGAQASNGDLIGVLNRFFATGTDDLWLAQNLQYYGQETQWPIHLRVEREMKPWGDTGGKGAVFEILRAANRTAAGNAQLTAAINRLFGAGTDDVWLAQNLQAHGPEANWPLPLKIERDLKPWGGGAAAVLTTLEGADETTLATIRADAALLDRIQAAMNDAQFARAAALFVLIVPAGVGDPVAARAEALRILTVQLGNKTIARGSINNNIGVVIVPRNQLMTAVPQFASLAGQTTFDGRSWETTRGSGGLTVGGRVYTAIAEENLLGGSCTAVFNGHPVSGQYPQGYSTTSHEFAHTLHNYVLTAADRTTITTAYNARKATATAHPTDPDQWVDGREGCYASQTEHEFFAQLSNAYLGTNAGTDPATGSARHNSRDWVRTHEPAVFQILDRMYGGASLPGTNPHHP